MKKIFLFLGLLALPCIGTAANKKIQMVTYFPTPYVAYSNVQATDTLDVGLTGTCEMTLGCGASTLALKASSAVVVQKGTFDLNAAGRVQSETVTLGKDGGEGTFNFDADLVVTTLKNGQSVEATNMQVDNLYLFPSHTTQDGRRFPKCDDITMSWQKLSDNQTYLVCGAVQEPQECTSHPYDTKGSDPYYLGHEATMDVAKVLSMLTAKEDLCCSGNKITDLDGTALSEDELEWYYQSGVCCNPKLCCTAGGDSDGSGTQCTSDFTNPNALKGAVSGWACGGDTQVFFYSCTGKGSTEPVCKYQYTHIAVTKNFRFTAGMESIEKLAEQSAESGQPVECPSYIAECPRYSDPSCSQSTANSNDNKRTTKRILSECECSYTSGKVLEFCTCTIADTIEECKCN